MSRKLIALFITSTLFVTIHVVTSRADVELTVRVVSASDDTRPVESVVLRRMHGKVVKFFTDENGVAPINVPACDHSIAFRAEPRNWQWKTESRWVPCTRNPLVFRASRVRHAAVIEPALKADLSKFSAEVPEIEIAREQFSAAMKTADYAVGATSANEIAAILRRLGEHDLAESYSVTAMEAAWRTLGETELPTEYFIAHDPTQKAWVMTRQGQAELLEFQKEAGVPVTGEWDWRTFQAIQLSEDPLHPG